MVRREGMYRSSRRRVPVAPEMALWQRAVANHRERQRTQQLNAAFSVLREVIPSRPSDQLSKVNTLRLATAYIDFLNEMLNSPEEANSVSQCGGPDSAFLAWRNESCRDEEDPFEGPLQQEEMEASCSSYYQHHTASTPCACGAEDCKAWYYNY